MIPATNQADGLGRPYLDQRPGHGKVYAPDLEVPELWRRFLAERPQRPLESHTPEAFVASLETVYADSMDWRNARGYSEEEVRRTLEASGVAASDEDVAAAHAQMNLQARVQLGEALRERFLKGTPLPAAEWEQVRDRVIFVHDRLTAEDVEELLDEWVDLDWRKAVKGAKVDPDLPARSAFAALEQQLPRAYRFRKIGEMTDPLPVDVYVGPEIPDED